MDEKVEYFFHFDTKISTEIFIDQIMKLHASISEQESPMNSEKIKSLLANLSKLCTFLPTTIDIKALPKEVLSIRESLNNFVSQAEGLIELEFSTFIAHKPKPLQYLTEYCYYANYVRIVSIESKILKENGMENAKKVAFVGSGAMPLSSILMATHHMKSTRFDNFDIDDKANEVARRIVASDAELEKRMKFETQDIMEVKEKLGQYDCIFLAALVGMNREAKVKIVEHIRMHMKEGSLFVVRSAKGARTFIYPSLEDHDFVHFELLTTFQPRHALVHSVLRKKPKG
ncbi:unnamed protein product [Lupinus luteus]|uniref:Nicotianamine synthase n=1 Tax=Lupinus luteus TaxID=3873 RepID=A0AAV1XIV2_LUPLU